MTPSLCQLSSNNGNDVAIPIRQTAVLMSCLPIWNRLGVGVSSVWPTKYDVACNCLLIKFTLR